MAGKVTSLGFIVNHALRKNDEISKTGDFLLFSLEKRMTEGSTLESTPQSDE
jgi:hypothetical protein